MVAFNIATALLKAFTTVVVAAVTVPQITVAAVVSKMAVLYAP